MSNNSKLQIDCCPAWPNAESAREVRFKLNQDFRFTPFPNSKENEAQHYLHPTRDFDKLLMLLRKQAGGSILVTGYRGTGKTSLVKKVLEDFKTERLATKDSNGEKEPTLLPIYLSLSVNLNSVDLIHLMLSQLKQQAKRFTKDGRDNPISTKSQNEISKLLKYVNRELTISRAPNVDISLTKETSERGQNVERRNLAAAQRDFCDLIRSLKKSVKLIFIFDELDKLVPNVKPSENSTSSHSTDVYAERLSDLQRLVSDLKFLLSEADSIQIFIAGKDVDDNWLEDQNKGEGLFESVFGQNLYIPTLLSAKIEPGEGIKDFAKSVGIPAHSWSYGTLALIYPNLSENTLDLLKPETNSQEENSEVCQIPSLYQSAFLTFIRYLTYKGRGIPRKILREFYTWIEQCTNDNSEIVIQLRSLRKMGFYADVVGHLEAHYDDFSWLEDRAKVATFHIIDYILKFYDTGFEKRDIEHANFMRFRPELYPSPSLVALVLQVFEGKLFRRMHRRGNEWRLLPSVIESLRYFSLAFSQEQMELRNTDGDHQAELRVLERTLSEVKESYPEQRLLSCQAQFRLGEINEHLGHFFDARLAYAKAIRWVRHDLSEILDYSPKDGQETPLRHQDIQTLVGMATKIYHRLGRLRERLGEFRDSLAQYHEAEYIFLAYKTHCKKRKLVDQSSRQFLASHKTNSEIKLPPQLFEALYQGTELQCKEPRDFAAGIHPMTAGRDPEQYRTTLNLLALAYEKLNERTAANTYLLKALQYTQTTEDEYGEIEQLLIIGQMQVKRRDVRTAALAYFESLRLADQLANLPFQDSSKGLYQIGSKYQTQPVETSIRARILTYLGDLYFATGGELLTKNKEAIKSQTGDNFDLEDHHKTLWRELLGRLGDAAEPRVFEDRVHEVFYTHARYYFRHTGDEISHIDVQLRTMALRMGNYRIACQNLDKNSEPEKESYLLYEQRVQFCSFWRAAICLFNEILGFDVQEARQVPRILGAISQRSRLGSLLKLIGEFCFMVTEGSVLIREQTLKLWCSPVLNEGHELKIKLESIFRKRANYAHLGEQIKERDPLNWVNLEQTKKSIGNIKNILKRLKLFDEQYEIFEELNSASLNDVEEDKAKAMALFTALGENAFVASYITLREAAPSIETATSALATGRHFLARTKVAYQAKKEEAFKIFYLKAKRYLIHASDILGRETQVVRSLRYLESEIEFALVDLLLLRFATRSDILEQSSLKVEKLNDKQIINDLDLNDIGSQVVEHYRKALEVTGKEVEDFRDRYPTPAETFFTNRHLIDPVRHFQVCKSIRARHDYWVRPTKDDKSPNENRPIRQKLHDIMEIIVTTARSPLHLSPSLLEKKTEAEEKEEQQKRWLSQIEKIHEKTLSLRVSPTILTISNNSSKFELQFDTSSENTEPLTFFS